MVYSDYAKQRMLSLNWQGFKVSEYLILKGVRHFLKHYRLSKTISRRPGSGLPPKLSPALQRIIEEEMAKDDETTATQLQAILASKMCMCLSLPL